MYRYEDRQTQDDADTLVEGMHQSFDGSEGGSTRSRSPHMRHAGGRENGTLHSSIHRHVNDDVYAQQQRNRSPSALDEGVSIAGSNRRLSPGRNGTAFSSEPFRGDDVAESNRIGLSRVRNNASFESVRDGDGDVVMNSNTRLSPAHSHDDLMESRLSPAHSHDLMESRLRPAHSHDLMESSASGGMPRRHGGTVPKGLNNHAGINMRGDYAEDHTHTRTQTTDSLVWGRNMYKDVDRYGADAAPSRIMVRSSDSGSMHASTSMRRYGHEEEDLIVVAGGSTACIMMSTGDVSDSESVEYDHSHSVGHDDSMHSKRARSYGDMTTSDHHRSRVHVPSMSSVSRQYGHESHNSEAHLSANRSKSHSNYSHGHDDVHQTPFHHGDIDKATGRDGGTDGPVLARKSVLIDSKASPTASGTRRSPTDIIAQVSECVPFDTCVFMSVSVCVCPPTAVGARISPRDITAHASFVLSFYVWNVSDTHNKCVENRMHLGFILLLFL